MGQTMYLEDVEQVINQTIDELMLGRCSVRHIRMHHDYVVLEFAAFSDCESVVETIRENFQELATRFEWTYCRIDTEANQITVTLMPHRPAITICAPRLPSRQSEMID